jgi:ribosomal protein S18 acetylase RimI-like enzyme
VTNYTLRPIERPDLRIVRQLVTRSWGAPTVVVGHARVVDTTTLPGFIAEADGEVVGLVTYEVRGDVAELVTLNAFRPAGGIGTALLSAVVDAARAVGCSRMVLMTTNDNTDGLRFYQRRGFRLRELRVNALARARELKPEIPEIGEHGIPIRDELELELPL